MSFFLCFIHCSYSKHNNRNNTRNYGVLVNIMFKVECKCGAMDCSLLPFFMLKKNALGNCSKGSLFDGAMLLFFCAPIGFALMNFFVCPNHMTQYIT